MLTAGQFKREKISSSQINFDDNKINKTQSCKSWRGYTYLLRDQHKPWPIASSDLLPSVGNSKRNHASENFQCHSNGNLRASSWSQKLWKHVFYDSLLFKSDFYYDNPRKQKATDWMKPNLKRFKEKDEWNYLALLSWADCWLSCD